MCAFLPQPSVEVVANLLSECRKKRDLVSAMHLNSFMCKSGLETHGYLGNPLVSMLSEHESMHAAQQVFDKLECRDVFSLSLLFIGYVKCGKPQDALALYQKMQNDDTFHHCDHSFVALLRACAKLRDLERGIALHAEVSRLGFPETNQIIGSALVDMYAKCGSLAKAQHVFDKLPSRNVVSWTALITGYTDYGHGKEALDIFEQMLSEHVSPNGVTFICSLKASSCIGDIIKGQMLHAEIEKHGLMGDVVVGNALVDMYAKCSFLDTACYLFDKLPNRDIVSWTALISGYVEHGHGEEALNYFEEMQLEGVSADAFVFVCGLRACGSIRAVKKGIEIHDAMKHQGLLESNLFVGSALVDMYAKCGLLQKAHNTFDKLKVRNVISWNALIAGYTEHGHGEEVLKLFGQMQNDDVVPESATFVCSLKACGSIRSLDRGQLLHAEIERLGLLETHGIIGNVLVDMYVKCGAFSIAEQVFISLSVRDLVSWNALISGYVEHGDGEKMLECFEQMQVEDVSPDPITYIFCLKACGSLKAADKGHGIHCEVERRGFLEKDIAVGNSLIDMYAKCDLFSIGQQVLRKLSVKTTVSWNTLIAGLVDYRHSEEALKCFEEMLFEGFLPDAFTYVCCLSACGSSRETMKGREIHAEIERQGLMDKDVIIGNALIDMYAKCGLLVKAQQVFDKLPVRDVVSWNALLAGYAEHGLSEDSLNCLEKMQIRGISPNAVTLVCSLKACAEMGAIGMGQEIHAEVERQGLLERDPAVGNILVDIYGRCGWLALAQQVSDKLPVRSVVSQTALMAGYAQLGESLKVFYMFDSMLGEGINPDPVTFTVVLNACSRTGLVFKSQTYFEAMSKDYGIIPSIEHHGCVIDLLSRAGQLDHAVMMVEKLPVSPNLVVWQSVLNACTKSGHMEFAKHAFNRSLHLDERKLQRMSSWLTRPDSGYEAARSP